MRHFIYVSVLCAIWSQPLRAATWLTDLGAAKLRVAAENKPILMLFTGSDWCPACQNLKRDVFARPEFASYADANLILLELDFPRYRALPASQKQANTGLASAYRIQYYPTMILLDARGQEVVRPRYDGKGVKDFLAKLDNYVHNNFSVAQGTARPRGVSARAHASTTPEPVPLFNGAATSPPPRYTDLVLKNISGTSNRRFALINNQTFAAGEAARVKLADGEVQVRCLEIRPHSVVITVAGQAGPRELKLADAP